MTNPAAIFTEAALDSLWTKIEWLDADGMITPVTTLESLIASLTREQWALVERIIDLRPADYGVTTPYEGDLEPVPDDLVVVRGQQYAQDGEHKTFGDKYVPRPVFDAYTAMNDAFIAEHPTRRLLIQSAYRSPAYQVVVFLNWLISTYDGDVAKTIRHASPPRYSQHTIASKVAIDFATIDGAPSSSDPDDFKRAIEYRWLRAHAADFGFRESWQPGNPYGMRPEPWHWQYRPA